MPVVEIEKSKFFLLRVHDFYMEVGRGAPILKQGAARYSLVDRHADFLPGGAQI